MSFLKHPLLGRVSSTFLLCGTADVTSQLFLSTPARVDPDRSVRFSAAGALSVIPVWFGWTKLFNAPILDLKSLLRRIAGEAFILGPLYLSSMLWWNSTLRTNDPVEAFTVVRTSAFSLYLDALKVVPAYNAFTYFAIAPHMRGYSLTFFQFMWNIYVSWFVNEATRPRSAPTGSMMELYPTTPQIVS